MKNVKFMACRIARNGNKFSFVPKCRLGQWRRWRQAKCLVKGRKVLRNYDFIVQQQQQQQQFNV